MIDNWHNRQKNNLESTDERNDIKTLKTTLIDSKNNSHIVQKKLGMIEVGKECCPIEIMQEKDDIERQKSNNKKDDIIMERTTRIEDKGKNPSAIEIMQNKNLDIIDEDKEK